MWRVLVLLVGLGSGAAWAQAGPSLRLEVVGGPVQAIEGESPGCDRQDIPDAPARAIRLANGTVQLYATDQVNRVNQGADLLHLRHGCTVVFRGAGRDDPAAFDDHAWITSPWTEDGRTIWAIVHNEFHGNERPALCPTRRYMDCWFNALTLAVSRDGGAQFQRAAGPALVAAVPYRYDQAGRGHHGYFNPSNIVAFRGALYMFAFATRTNAQSEGNCLLRSEAIATAGSWRGWDGSGFGVTFMDPYGAVGGAPEQHVCAPVGAGRLRWPVTSLVQHGPSGLFLAIMQDTAPTGGVYYATSPDLVTWSEPALLGRTVGLPSWQPGDQNPIAYPSILDPGSPDRNFSVVGGAGLVFATRFDMSQGRAAMRRTLQRWPVRLTAAPERQPQ